MKTLILMRHAKSAWDDPELEDFARPLAKRGRKAARAMGQYLAAQGFRPDHILCSSAQRTRETLERLGDIADGASVEFDQALYLAEPQAILRRLARLPDGAASVLLIGHNPGLEALALRLTPAGSAQRQALAAKFPTAALAWFVIDAADWRALEGRTHLKRFVTPAELAAE